MKKAKILIVGQIGTSHNADGTVNVKGVQLQDVVSQVEAAKKADNEIAGYDIFINSLGGSVDVGKEIAKYIGSLENAYTIADTQCASMGTEIHLAVPVENRSIIAGTQYSIHNPLLVNVSGNAGQLEDMADYIKDSEKAMVKMYTKATGMDKEAVIGLMNQETSLTDEECKTMGFVSEIIAAEKLNAVAFFENKKQPKQEITMSGIKSYIKEAFATMAKELNPKAATEEAVKTEFVTAQGKLNIVHAEKELAVGDVATLEGKQAPVGDYTLENNSVLKIDETGKVASIIPAKEENEETIEEKVARLEAEGKEKDDKIASMEDEFKTQLSESMEAMKKEIGSGYTPQKAVAQFSKKTTGKDEAPDVVADAAERKKSYRKVEA